jgi:hypothetical protein
VSGRPVKAQPVTQDDRVKRAYGIMNDIRSRLYKRLAEYVLSNEQRIRSETLGEETYSFCLQQMDDLFLNKLNVVERAVAELARHDPREGQPTTTTYETVEVTARREDLPQRVADTLAEHGESDLLGINVLRADEKHAEILLIMAREDVVPPSGQKPGAAGGETGGSGGSERQRGEGGTSGDAGT